MTFPSHCLNASQLACIENQARPALLLLYHVSCSLFVCILLFEPFEIDEILFAAACPFIFQKVFFGENGHRLIREHGLNPPRPGFLKLNACDCRQDIDPQRGKSDLKGAVTIVLA